MRWKETMKIKDVLKNKPTSMNNKMAVYDSCNIVDIDVLSGWINNGGYK